MAERKNKYNQLCVWEGTMLGDAPVKEFEDFFKDAGFRVKFAEETITLPDKDEKGQNVKGTGGRHDILFYVHDKDIPKFAIWRFRLGIRWWEDIFYNHQQDIYGQDVKDKYIPAW